MEVSGSRSGRMTELELTTLCGDQQREIIPQWTEPPNGKLRSSVAVVYYISRNGQLEHPHFMEVPLSSPHGGLFLTDVISRLNVLRGKGMAAMYSWSCKRSYKNGYVWHDLSDNDLIYPAHGHDYVLKGAELPAENTLEKPPENHLDRRRRRRNQSCSSIDFNLHEYSVYKAEPSSRSAADASTQTDDIRRRRRPPPPPRDEIEISTSISPPPSDSSPETLETLMKADRRIVLQEPKANISQINQSKSSVLMQLISCGSIAFKDCGPGHVGLGLMRLPRGGRKLKLEEKDYFSGSLVEANKEELFPTLKRSTSYNADR